MGIHLRIYKDSPNSTEFQGMNRTPFFDPKKGVPYQRLSPQSGSDGFAKNSEECLGQAKCDSGLQIRNCSKGPAPGRRAARARWTYGTNLVLYYMYAEYTIHLAYKDRIYN